MITRKISFIMVVCMLLAGGVCWAQILGQPQAQAQAPAPTTPLTEKDVMAGLKKNAAGVASQVSERGVDFDLTPEIEKRLRKAKADDTLIDLIKKGGPTARAEAAKAGGAVAGPKITKEEYEAFQGLRNELDPDKAIAGAKDFETKFPNSALLSYAYMFAANAYQQKNDLDHMVEMGEKSLKLNKDNLPSLIMVSAILPQPQFLNAHKDEKDKLLTEASDYATRALTLIADAKTVGKQGNETDEQFTKRKDALASGAHASLGMIHLERSQMALEGVDKEEIGKAEKEFEQAVSMTDRPSAQDYYRLGEAYRIDGKLDQAIQSFTKAGELGQGSVIKTFADRQIQDLQKQKGPAKPAAKP